MAIELLPYNNAYTHELLPLRFFFKTGCIAKLPSHRSGLAYPQSCDGWRYAEIWFSFYREFLQDVINLGAVRTFYEISSEKLNMNRS